MQRLTRRLPAEAHRSGDTKKLWQINKYLWMSLAFVVVYLPVAQAQGLLTAPSWVVWAFFGLAVADGASRSLLAYRKGGSLPDSWAWFFTGLDIALIAAGIALTGGIFSDLWLLFFVVMIFESLYATPIQKRLMDFCVSVAYLLATAPGQFSLPPPMVWSEYTRVVVSRLFFLILVSALGRRISANTEERSRELALLHEQMATAEERGRIAREVHDSLGHALVSSILRLELCARLLRKNPEEAEVLLKEEIPALRAAWNEGRDLAFHLRPWEMEATTENSLIETLRRHTGRFAERTGLIVNLKTEGEERTLRPEVCFCLIRVVQEALTNAAKHAQASAIEVALTYAPEGNVTCAIRDDGAGFIVEERKGGFGMQAMRDRVQEQGGVFTIESAPGHGTTVFVALPV